MRNGYLRLGHSPEDLAAFERSVEVQRELGVPDAAVLGPDDLRGVAPDLRSDDLAGGLFGPSDGYIDGHLYCNLLAQLLRDRGARILTSTELVGLDGRRLATSGPTLECDVVVNAAGAWAGEVGELLGTPARILPERHQALVAHLPRELDYVMPSVMDYIPGSGGLGLYFRHESASSMIAGLHTEEPYEELPQHAFMEEVAARLAHRLPGLAGARLGGLWSGFYPISQDGFPAVGPYRDRPGVVAALGAGGSGLQSSPAIGCIAAEWIALGECRTIPAAAALLPDRPSFVGAP
jgi:sarcosine oxidase subunit beta